MFDNPFPHDFQEDLNFIFKTINSVPMTSVGNVFFLWNVLELRTILGKIEDTGVKVLNTEAVTAQHSLLRFICFLSCVNTTLIEVCKYSLKHLLPIGKCSWSNLVAELLSGHPVAAVLPDNLHQVADSLLPLLVVLNTRWRWRCLDINELPSI